MLISIHNFINFLLRKIYFSDWNFKKKYVYMRYKPLKCIMPLETNKRAIICRAIRRTFDIGAECNYVATRRLINCIIERLEKFRRNCERSRLLVDEYQSLPKSYAISRKLIRYIMAIIENHVIRFEILYVTLLQLISRNGTHLINLFNDAINFHIESYYSHIILYRIKKLIYKRDLFF